MQFHKAIVNPVIDLGMRSLCVKPYHNHPKGCPNFGKKSTCPPKCGRFPYVFDTQIDIWALWAVFDLEAHVRRMRKRHPLWTYRQLSCCLYWQPTMRKFLREHIAEWRRHHPLVAVTTCPEGMGVNVTATMKEAGVNLEWPPKKYTRLIYLAGILKNEEERDRYE